MIENLLRPLFLARLAVGASSALLVLYGAKVGLEVLRGASLALGSEERIRLERRAELAATLVQVALAGAVAGAFLLALAADRAHSSIRGAMCAYGVLGSTRAGFAAVGTSLAVSVLAGAWLALHRLDLALPDPRLTRTKFLALLAIAPVVLLDLATFVRFVLELDFSVIASCCSVGLDSASGATRDGAERLSIPIFPLATVALATAALAMAALAKRRTRLVAFVAAASGLVGSALSLPTIVEIVAPHVYESPSHRCPFCLLHAEAWGIGWPLFGAVVGSAIASLAVLVVELERKTAGAEVEAAEARLGRFGAMALFAVLALCLVPIVRYRLVTGTFLPGVFS
ncbi:MAG: hypothetical protein U0230_02245 [Polyangiales bacterium]